MPEMDGFETLERLKQDSKLKGVPVVMLSGLSQNEDIDRAIGLGAVAYLRKTQTLPTDCLGKIREVLKI
jgi:CheY-like chemotaxis protein